MIGDLHIHSVYSDGSDTPLKIAETAKKNGVEVISVTDHDGTGDTEEKIRAAKQYNLRYIKGLEFSSYSGDEQVHILGYGCENTPIFSDIMKKLGERRLERTVIMLDRLKKYYGIDISIKEVENTSTESMGSMHIARAIIKKGYAVSVREAFKNYIGQGAKAYCAELRQTPAEAIKTILNSNGIPVLAHPGKIKSEFLPLFSSLAENGLRGIEAYYSSHTKEQTEYFLNLARQNNLIVTCGSDYHGNGREERIGVPCYDFDEETLGILKII